MQTRTRSCASILHGLLFPNSAAGVHCGSTAQNAGQLQLVFRKQHPLPRQRNSQMDLPSLSRCRRALHGQWMRCAYSNTAVFPLLFITFGPQGIIRCEVISQGSACVTCAGLWAKTSQTRASVFEHNRDVAGVRFELRSGFCSWLSFSIPSFFGAAALATFAPRHRKRVCCAPFCCLSACLPPCDAF